MDDDEQEEGEIRPEVGNKDEPMGDDKSDICGGAPDDDHHETEVLPEPTTVAGNIDSDVDKPEMSRAIAGDLPKEEKSNLPVGVITRRKLIMRTLFPKRWRRLRLPKQLML